MSPKPSPPVQSAASTSAAEDEDVVFQLSKQELLGLQIQALLDASDDVDITADVAEELLSCLPTPDEDEDEDTPADERDDAAGPCPTPFEAQKELGTEETIEIIAKNGNVDIWDIFDPYNKGQSSLAL